MLESSRSIIGCMHLVVSGTQYETKRFYKNARSQHIKAQMRITNDKKSKFTSQHHKSKLSQKLI